MKHYFFLGLIAVTFIVVGFYAVQFKKNTFHGILQCGPITKFKDAPWFQYFINLLREKNIEKMSGRIELSTITESCFMPKQKVFISIAPGAYMEEPTILQFNLQEKKLTTATIASPHIISSPDHFGPQEGTIFHMVAKTGDAGCAKTQYMDYAVTENILTLKKGCSQCEDDAREECETF